MSVGKHKFMQFDQIDIEVLNNMVGAFRSFADLSFVQKERKSLEFSGQICEIWKHDIRKLTWQQYKENAEVVSNILPDKNIDRGTAQ